MKITEKEVRYVADLANLKLTDAEIARMQTELDAILTHMDTLNQLDTTGVEPMAQVLFEAEETATLRDDVEGATLPNQEVVSSAPHAGGGFFKVPRVIER